MGMMETKTKPIKPVHPFPARMAPDLAIQALSRLSRGSRVLDPMAGSGTVLRHAVALGHVAIGRDLDPLAVLMTRVWNTSFDSDKLLRRFNLLRKRAEKLPAVVELPWIDEDAETTAFVDYWFAKEQQQSLHVSRLYLPIWLEISPIATQSWIFFELP